MKKIIIVVLLLIAIAVGFIGFQRLQKTEEVKKIISFDECVAAGNAVQESYPPRCTTADGQSFTQDIGNELEHKDTITVSNPRPNQKITSPLSVTGQASGVWFFEATFPFELFDANGKSLGKGFTTAEGEWMTESLVPFSASLDFEKATTSKGKLIIKNANPSGLPENEKELVIPVMF